MPGETAALRIQVLLIRSLRGLRSPSCRPAGDQLLDHLVGALPAHLSGEERRQFEEADNVAFVKGDLDLQ